MNKTSLQHTAPALIIAIGIVILGLCIRSGIYHFTDKDRKVVVKGLAEKEVNADKVTWPIVSKEIGNDLPELYQRIAVTQAQIKKFLHDGGISDSEISVNAPVVIDLNADQYSDNKRAYRYNVTSIITVTSGQVAQVRALIARQGELFKQGIAIVSGDYDNRVRYEFVAFRAMKPKMMQEAIANAEQTAQQFANSSKSTLGKIISADQGQFSIDDRDPNTPYIKKVRVVSTVTYALND